MRMVATVWKDADCIAQFVGAEGGENGMGPYRCVLAPPFGSDLPFSLGDYLCLCGLNGIVETAAEHGMRVVVRTSE